MMSNRTNPKPHVYIAELTANEITRAEKNHLIQCVKTWPGGNPTIVSATVNDINKAQTVD